MTALMTREAKAVTRPINNLTGIRQCHHRSASGSSAPRHYHCDKTTTENVPYGEQSAVSLTAFVLASYSNDSAQRQSEPRDAAGPVLPVLQRDAAAMRFSNLTAQ